MNRKGFTLIELLAIIVIMALVAVIVFPGVINMFNVSKDNSYDILVNNIKIAGENYYNECEYGDLSLDKYGDLSCNINGDYTTTVSLGNLVSLGILKVSNKNGLVINPKTGESINECVIKVKKNVDSDTYKTTYVISLNSSCPSLEELE